VFVIKLLCDRMGCRVEPEHYKAVEFCAIEIFLEIGNETFHSKVENPVNLLEHKQ